MGLCAGYDVGGQLDVEDGTRTRTHEEWNEKVDSSQYEALLKGGEQVTSVLEEMITLVISSSCFLDY